MVKKESQKRKSQKLSQLQRTAAARLEGDSADEAPVPGRRQSQGGAAAGGSQRRGGSWRAASNVPEALQPHVKRAFIQVMMNRGFLHQHESAEGATRPHDEWATGIYQELSGAPDASAFDDFLADCNGNLAMLEFQIRRILFPGTGTWFVALVNLAADEASKMLTHKYSPAELAYFRALVEMIATREDCDKDGVPRIRATDALNLDVETSDVPLQTQGEAAALATQGSQARKTLNMEAKQVALGRFTEDGWVAKSQLKGYGIIGPRTFMALGPWLRSLDTPEATKRVWDDLL